MPSEPAVRAHRAASDRAYAVGRLGNQAWGVTRLGRDGFPDIRFKTAIYSANEGNVLIIPRGSYLGSHRAG